MEQVNNDFFRKATPNEHALIKENEDIRYGKEIKSIRILLIGETVAVVAGILGLFLPLHLGPVRSIILILLGAFMFYMTYRSYIITKRQYDKIGNSSYMVQTSEIIDVHNDFHGLRSDMIATFKNEAGNTYVLNTNTTGDTALISGLRGLLVIIDDEKNVYLTSKYRFYEETE